MLKAVPACMRVESPLRGVTSALAVCGSEVEVPVDGQSTEHARASAKLLRQLPATLQAHTQEGKPLRQQPVKSANTTPQTFG
jgi:hypothetical protein